MEGDNVEIVESVQKIETMIESTVETAAGDSSAFNTATGDENTTKKQEKDSAKTQPADLRTILLAYPRRCVKKYKPKPYVPGQIETGVKPGAVKMPPPPENWRLNELAKCPPFKISPKWVFVPPKGVQSGVPRKALTFEATRRLIHMAFPTMRFLKMNTQYYKHLGNPFVKNMSKLTEQSWNSIYYWYRKQKLEQKQKRIAQRKAYKAAVWAKKYGKPLTAKEKMEKQKKEFAEWVAIRALPRRVFPPRRVRKRKVADLIKIAAHMNMMAQPRSTSKKYIRPSRDKTYRDPNAVKEGAKKYVPSDRVKHLAELPARWLGLLPALEPGKVSRGALKAKASARVGELATPKRKAAQKESDEKENPFEINPWALKAKPSQRTKELARPIDR